MRREVEADKDSVQRGISLLLPLLDQVIDCHGFLKDRQKLRAVCLPCLDGWMMSGTLCLRDQKGSGMCHSAAWTALYSKTSSLPPNFQDAKRPRGQSGSRWGGRCQVVFKRGSCLSAGYLGGLRGSRVLFGLQVNRIYLVAWARTISLARLARLAGIEYMCILLERGLLSSYSSSAYHHRRSEATAKSFQVCSSAA